MQRATSKTKAAAKIICIEAKEDAIFILLQRDQFAEEMKSLKVDEEIAAIKCLKFSPFNEKRDLFVPQKSIALQCKTYIIVTLET